MKKGKRKVRDGELKEKVKKLSSFTDYSKERKITGIDWEE